MSSFMNARRSASLSVARERLSRVWLTVVLGSLLLPAFSRSVDAQTSNDYVVVHERSIEIVFILKTLKSYRGELTILGKPLAEKWAAAQLAAGT